MKVIAEPQNARSRRTSAALLQAGRDLIEEQGFQSLTMGAVAARADVSRRAVYLHFADRTDLLAALYRSLGQSEELAVSLQAVWDCPDAVTALTEWAHHIARSHPRILGVLRAVEHERHNDADAADLRAMVQGNWLKGSRRLIRWLADDGRLASHWNVDSASDLVWALMSLDVLSRLLDERHWSQSQLADHLDKLFQSAFVA